MTTKPHTPDDRPSANGAVDGQGGGRSATDWHELLLRGHHLCDLAEVAIYKMDGEEATDRIKRIRSVLNEIEGARR